MLPKNLTILDEPNVATEGNSFEVNEFITKKLKDDKGRRSTLGNKLVLTAEEVNRVRVKFLADIDFAFEEAIQKHRGVASTEVPLWLWALLLWFASDNILGYMASPILYYPLILIGSVLLCAWQLELLPILVEIGVPKAKSAVNELLMKTPLSFRV